MADFDARTMNWRFVVPDEPPGLLLLRVGEEQLAGAVTPGDAGEALSNALEAGPYPAVVAQDLARWASLLDVRPRDLLLQLGAGVEARGWLAVGISNPWSPTRPFGHGSVRATRAARALNAAGFCSVRSYLAFPDQRCPAYLIGADDRAELNYLLGRLFLPYVGEVRGMRARIKQRVVRAGRRVALFLPHRLRVGLAPASLLVARKS
jgi:hypothetical protein